MLSDAQKEAYTKAKGILSEHFESFVLVAEAEVFHKEEVAYLWSGSYYGSLSTAVGLLAKYQAELIQSSINSTVRDSS